MEKQQLKGLTGFQIKMIGLCLMVFDHIYEFFIYTEAIPVGFKWMGRIVAPIFIFMTVQGFIHTRNRKKYMIRLYLGSVFMTVVSQCITRYFPRADDFVLMNNIFGTLFMITVYLWIVSFMEKEISNKNPLGILLGLIMMIIPFAFGVGMMSVISILPQWAIQIIFIVPNPIFVEGGFLFIVLGVLFYLMRHSKLKTMAMYILFSLGLIFITGKPSINSLLWVNYQWMMVFAAPFIYMYNGQKGKGMKYLFYTFYPAHIYAFYFLSLFLMNSMK